MWKTEIVEKKPEVSLFYDLKMKHEAYQQAKKEYEEALDRTRQVYPWLDIKVK